MHMSDALISVPVATVFWTVSGATLAYASRKLKKDGVEEKNIPFMGVTGAFVFALQMVNFSIPATGSSGHFTGGFLLALLLGSESAFLVISSVLLVQSLFFADGGILSLGCNIFNMGFIPAYIIYPLFKNLVKKHAFFIWLGAFLSLIAGSVTVSVQTAFSGISELPFSKMLMLMVTIHLLIGIVEGVITVGSYKLIKSYSLKYIDNTSKTVKPYFGLLGISLIIASVLSLFASENPDGLEWSVFKITGSNAEPASVSGKIHAFFAYIQEHTAFLPGYNFHNGQTPGGTSFSGIIGAIVTIIVAVSVGYLINKVSKR